MKKSNEVLKRIFKGAKDAVKSDFTNAINLITYVNLAETETNAAPNAFAGSGELFLYAKKLAKDKNILALELAQRAVRSDFSGKTEFLSDDESKILHAQFYGEK